MKTSLQYDVVIIGGGLVGASLAAALKHSGLSLALVEASAAPATADSAPKNNSQDDPEINWDSRIYAISPGSRRFLEQSGAWALLPASASRR